MSPDAPTTPFPLAAKKAAATKAKAPAKQRIAVKLLTELPPLDERRRRVYRAAFSDEACADWGNATKSVRLQTREHIGLRRRESTSVRERAAARGG